MRKIFFLILLLIGYWIWGDDISLPDRLADLGLLSGKKNIVVMGCDIRKDDVGRSDTLFVVMLDKNNKNASLLSIPRDTRVKIKDHGWDKVNAAFAYGGQDLTRDTVQEFLGIKLHNYVVVDFQGFKDLVDVIGGVDINVEKRMYYYDPYANFEIDLRPGMQHMDGKTAMQYVRYRDEEGDIGRIRRQQKFIMALYKQIASKNIIAKMPGVSKQIMSMIKTDLSLKEMVELGKVMHGMMEKDGLKMAMVPGEPEYIDGISYWIPNLSKLRMTVADTLGLSLSGKYKTQMEADIREYENSIPSGASEVPASDTSIGRAKPSDSSKNRRREDKADKEKRPSEEKNINREERSRNEERRERNSKEDSADSSQSSVPADNTAAVPTPSTGISKTR